MYGSNVNGKGKAVNESNPPGPSNNIEGLRPQFGATFSDLLQFITSDENNKICLDATAWVTKGSIVSLSDVGVVFHNAPFSVQYNVYTQTVATNNLIDVGGSSAPVPYQSFSLSAKFCAAPVYFFEKYYIKVSSVEVLNGKPRGVVKTSPIFTVDPIRPESFALKHVYTKSGHYLGTDLSVTTYNTMQPGMFTICNPHPSIQSHITLYRGDQIIGSHYIPPIGIKTTDIIPSSFVLVALEVDNTGNVVGEIARKEFGPGLTAFLCMTGVTGSVLQAYAFSTVKNSMVVRMPDMEELVTVQSEIARTEAYVYAASR